MVKTTEIQQGKIKSIIKHLPDDLEDLSKEELIQKLKLIQECVNPCLRAPRKNKSEIDFRKYKKRHIALRLLYLGWDCDGFVVQDNTEETIEAHLFEALMLTKMIDSRQNSNYHRCGRTDKGVSAFFQVISLDVRSDIKDGPGVFSPEDYIPNEGKEKEQELDYVGILNRVLPQNIRVISWAPVERNFSARFNCIEREYKYWFPKSNLNISKMADAASYLIGEHDFRNFCKMDVKNDVTNYVRKITHSSVEPLGSVTDGSYQMMEFTIRGTAFLWHQIRCIMTVLFLVGSEKEDAKVVQQMLDIETHPRKPQYDMACEIPLALYDSKFEGINWIHDEQNLMLVMKHIQCIWTKQSAKTTMIVRMLQDLKKCGLADDPNNQADSLMLGVRQRVYKPLLERNVCESLEEKIANRKRKKPQQENSTKETECIAERSAKKHNNDSNDNDLDENRQ